MNRSDSTGEVLNEVTLSRPVRVGVRSVMPLREKQKKRYEDNARWDFVNCNR
jgi:hypothetical protein